MYFPHPVLGAPEQPYGEKARYTLAAADFWRNGVIDLKFEHSLTECPDLEGLIKTGQAIFTTELFVNDQHQYFHKVSGDRIRQSRIQIPTWAIKEAASFTVTARIIANSKISYKPLAVTEDYKGEYEILPGTILAIQECECQITPPAESPLITVIPHDENRIRTDFDSDEKIILAIPRSIHEELVEIHGNGHLSAHQIRLIEYGVLVEAISILKASSALNKPWMIRLIDLARRMNPPIDIATSDMSSTELANILFDNPISASINDLCMRLRQSSQSDEN